MERISVVGLGYVGLSLCSSFSKAGFKVAGIDTDANKIKLLGEGFSPISGLSNSEIGEMNLRGFEVSANYSSVSDSSAVIVGLPTPLDTSRRPDLQPLIAGIKAIEPHVKDCCLVIIESTVSPGTTERTILNTLQVNGKVLGRDFLLAYSPERINPGLHSKSAKEIPKIVAGLDRESLQAATELYRMAGFETIPSSSVATAETAKLLENTYRAVNIALVSELAEPLSKLGINIQSAVELAATKPFGYEAFFPGAGVGGHCIPIDPRYLQNSLEEVGFTSSIIETASKLNAAMPASVASRLDQILKEPSPVWQSPKTLLLGMTYKADVNDFRESPGPSIARALANSFGHTVTYHDPFLTAPLIGLENAKFENDLKVAIKEHHNIVILQNHSAYSQLMDEHVSNNIIFVDLMNAPSRQNLWEPIRSVDSGSL